MHGRGKEKGEEEGDREGGFGVRVGREGARAEIRKTERQMPEPPLQFVGGDDAGSAGVEEDKRCRRALEEALE
jgi:hypothetical protein